MREIVKEFKPEYLTIADKVETTRMVCSRVWQAKGGLYPGGNPYQKKATTSGQGDVLPASDL